MFSRLVLPAITAIFLGSFTDVQAQFTLDAEIRPRGEFRNGFKTPRPDEADPAFFIEQRSRLYFGYRADRIKLQLNVQDIRIWGNANQIYKEDPGLSNIHEGWAELKLSDHFYLKLGRQGIGYDNERFLGELGWAAQSRSHDALLLKYENDSTGWKLHVGGAFNQSVPFEPAQLESTFYSGVNNYKTMAYLWAHKSGDFGKISFLSHTDGRQTTTDTSMAFLQTLGLYGMFPLGESPVSLTGELYFQGGRDARDRRTSALMAALHANLRTPKNIFTIGAEYMSGTDRTETVDNNSFEPLYGTNHKFYGFMDYFYVGNAHGQNGNLSGLVDLHLKGTFSTGKGKLSVAAHNFLSPVAIYDLNNPSEELSSHLGLEVDFVYDIRIVPSVNLQCGYSQMFGTSSMEAIKAAPGAADKFNNWVFLMIGFKPQLLNTANLQTRN